jgi:hypothetical protein
MADVMIAMLFGALLFAAGFWTAYVMLRPIYQQRGTSMADLLRDAITETGMRDEPEDEPEDTEEPALPIDPDNPPFPRVYHRREGRPPRTCHCHGRELRDGEAVLFWPNPDVEGAFWLVCPPEELQAVPT